MEWTLAIECILISLHFMESYFGLFGKFPFDRTFLWPSSSLFVVVISLLLVWPFCVTWTMCMTLAEQAEQGENNDSNEIDVIIHAILNGFLNILGKKVTTNNNNNNNLERNVFKKKSEMSANERKKPRSRDDDNNNNIQTVPSYIPFVFLWYSIYRVHSFPSFP